MVHNKDMLIEPHDIEIHELKKDEEAFYNNLRQASRATTE